MLKKTFFQMFCGREEANHLLLHIRNREAPKNPKQSPCLISNTNPDLKKW